MRPSSGAPTSRSRSKSALFDGVWEVGRRYPVWMSHGDRVTRLPDGFTVKATSENAPFAVAADEARRIYTTMFHPEVVHTPDGAKLLANFVHKIAGPGRRLDDGALPRERGRADPRAGRQGARDLRAVGRRRFSAVAAVLIHEAIGDQLTCVFVDHGLMRQDEAEEVVPLFRGHYNIPLVHVDARERFLGALAGVDDPGAEAQDHRHAVHRRVRGGGDGSSAARRVPGAGHALSGRDRERVVHRRARR